MNATHTYFPRSTAQQRKLLFETWQTTGSIAQACEMAHLSRVTFHHWKPRFDAHGYAGLEHPLSHRPNHLARKTSAAIESEVLTLTRAHPEWGKQRLAHEVAKAHGWVAVVSANTVRRILAEAGLWQKPAPQKKTTAPRSDARRTNPDRR
jgi:transposase